MTSGGAGSSRPSVDVGTVRIRSTAAGRLLRRGFLMLNQRQWTRLELTLTVGDPSGQLTQAWMAAQELQLLYARSHDLPDAKRRLWRILDRCARSDVPELLRRAAGLLDDDRPTRRQQRPDRSPQRPDQERQAGPARLPELHNYRLRLLLPVGLDWRTVPWQASPAPPIRGRSPRLVA